MGIAFRQWTDAHLHEDKTQVFTKQIETKQRELQPWSAKLRHKEGEIKIARNEQDSLKRKVEAVKTAGTEAKAALEALRAGRSGKENDKNQVQQEKAETQQELADKQRSFEVQSYRVGDEI